MERLIEKDDYDSILEQEQKALESDDDLVWERNKKYYAGLAIARRRLWECRTIDAVPMVRGEWIREFDELGIDRGWKCAVCRCSVYAMTYEPYMYCPHCGARMDGERKTE